MKKLLFLMLGLLFFIGATAQQFDPMAVIPNDPSVRIGTLDNGAKYYLRANKKDPQRANFYIVYNVGALQEEDRQDGLAHFLEHMGLNGSKNFPGSMLIDYLQSIGIAFGADLNAFTSQQNTAYMVTNVPLTRPTITDSVLLVLHDWAGFITLDDKEIDEERGVIQEEFRLYEGMAQMRMSRKETAALFGSDNLYTQRDVIGPLENLKNFTYADIKDFYKKWYRPDMQAFVIVGDIDVDEMEAKLKAVMADVPAHEVKTPKNVVTVADNDTIRVAVITDPEATGTQVSMIYRHPATPDKYNDRVGKFRSDLINNLACAMFNDRVSELAKKPDMPFLGAYVYTSDYYKPFSMFGLGLRARDGKALEAFDLIYTELLRGARSGFIAAELDRAKVNRLSQVEKAYTNRNDRRNGELSNTLQNNFMAGKPIIEDEVWYTMSKAMLETITLDEVNAQFASMIRDQNRVLTLTAKTSDVEGFVPTEAELLATLAAVEAKTIEPYAEQGSATELMDASKLKGSKVAKTEVGKFGSTVWTLKNGIKVVVKPTTLKADEVILNAYRNGGQSTIENLEDLYSINLYGNFENQAGLANFTSTELQRVLTGKTASLSPTIGELSEGFNGSSTKKDIETMFQLLYLYSTAPRFEASDWEVTMGNLKTMIEGQMVNPQWALSDSISSTLYSHNPRQAMLSLDMLKKVSLERLAKVYREKFSAMNDMTFTIVGSVSLDTLRPLVEKYIGSLPVAKGKKSYPIGPYVSKIATGQINNHFVTPQQAGRVTAFTFYSGVVANPTLSERLNLSVAGNTLGNVYLKTIREANGGGAYVAQNNLFTEDLGRETQFINQAVFLTDSSKLERLLPEVQKGVDSLCLAGPSAENLTKATEEMRKNFETSLLQNGTWASYLRRWYLEGEDSYTDYLETLKGITVESVQEAAKRAFGQGNRIEVIQEP